MPLSVRTRVPVFLPWTHPYQSRSLDTISLQVLLAPLGRGCLLLSGEMLVSLQVVLSSLRWQLVPLRGLLQCFFAGLLFSLEGVADMT